MKTSGEGHVIGHLNLNSATFAKDPATTNAPGSLDVSGVSVAGTATFQGRALSPLQVGFHSVQIGRLIGGDTSHTLVMTGGQIPGIIDLGRGNDSLVSGAKAERVTGNTGSDSYLLAGGTGADTGAKSTILLRGLFNLRAADFILQSPRAGACRNSATQDRIGPCAAPQHV